VTDKSASDVSACSSSRYAESAEVERRGGAGLIRETALAAAAADRPRNNEPTASVAAAAAADCQRAALTSGPSQACSQREGVQSTTTTAASADASRRGVPTSGLATSAAVDPTGSTSRGGLHAAQGRRTICDDDDDDAHRLPQHVVTDPGGLMCRRHDVTKHYHHVTDDVTAMADKRRKSPDPFCVDDDSDACAADAMTSQVPEDDEDDDELSLRRQNGVLTQLLSAKKSELEETRQRFKVCTALLEEEVDRLRAEKERLLDRLQLPEDERCSLSVEQQSLAELTRRLRQCEEQNEELKSENVELRQDLRDTELAMHELHDQFQAEEGVELRELQRELDNTARDCRLLHFKVSHNNLCSVYTHARVMGSSNVIVLCKNSSFFSSKKVAKKIALT